MVHFYRTGLQVIDIYFKANNLLADKKRELIMCLQIIENLVSWPTIDLTIAIASKDFSYKIHCLSNMITSRILNIILMDYAIFKIRKFVNK